MIVISLAREASFKKSGSEDGRKKKPRFSNELVTSCVYVGNATPKGSRNRVSRLRTSLADGLPDRRW